MHWHAQYGRTMDMQIRHVSSAVFPACVSAESRSNTEYNPTVHALVIAGRRVLNCDALIGAERLAH